MQTAALVCLIVIDDVQLSPIGLVLKFTYSRSLVMEMGFEFRGGLYAAAI